MYVGKADYDLVGDWLLEFDAASDNKIFDEMQDWISKKYGQRFSTLWLHVIKDKAAQSKKTSNENEQQKEMIKFLFEEIKIYLDQ